MATTAKFDSDTAKDNMLINLASAFNDTTKDPDIEITCNGYRWKCHKLILRSATEYFERAFAGGFKEKNSQTIDLQENLQDPEDAVEAMLRFCYAVNYDDQKQTEPATFNVRIFSLAEKYFVKGLDLLAVDKFAASAKTTTLPDLIQAIADAYTICSDPERLLKDKIINLLSEQENFLTNFSGEKKEYNELMESTPGFAADVTRVLAKKMQAARKRSMEPPELPGPKRIRTIPRGIRRYRCPDNCGSSFPLDSHDGSDTSFLQCFVTRQTHRLTPIQWQHYLLP